MACLRTVFLALLIAGPAASAAVGAAPPADEDAVIAQSLAEMLRDARTVISNNQELINNPELGDKHLSGQVVLDRAVKSYAKATGSDPTKIDPNSRKGRLLRAMMAAIVAATNENRATINEKGTGFKGFIPSVFGRLVSEDFNQMAKGEAEVKVTAPPELVRNRRLGPTLGRPTSSRQSCSVPDGPRGNLTPPSSRPTDVPRSGSRFPNIMRSPVSSATVRRKAKRTSPATRRRAVK